MAWCDTGFDRPTRMYPQFRTYNNHQEHFIQYDAQAYGRGLSNIRQQSRNQQEDMYQLERDFYQFAEPDGGEHEGFHQDEYPTDEWNEYRAQEIEQYQEEEQDQWVHQVSGRQHHLFGGHQHQQSFQQRHQASVGYQHQQPFGHHQQFVGHKLQHLVVQQHQHLVRQRHQHLVGQQHQHLVKHQHQHSVGQGHFGFGQHWQQKLKGCLTAPLNLNQFGNQNQYRPVPNLYHTNQQQASNGYGIRENPFQHGQGETFQFPGYYNFPQTQSQSPGPLRRRHTRKTMREHVPYKKNQTAAGSDVHTVLVQLRQLGDNLQSLSVEWKEGTHGVKLHAVCIAVYENGAPTNFMWLEKARSYLFSLFGSTGIRVQTYGLSNTGRKNDPDYVSASGRCFLEVSQASEIHRHEVIALTKWTRERGLLDDIVGKDNFTVIQEHTSESLYTLCEVRKEDYKMVDYGLLLNTRLGIQSPMISKKRKKSDDDNENENEPPSKRTKGGNRILSCNDGISVRTRQLMDSIIAKVTPPHLIGAKRRKVKAKRNTLQENDSETSPVKQSSKCKATSTVENLVQKTSQASPELKSSNCEVSAQTVLMLLRCHKSGRMYSIRGTMNNGVFPIPFPLEASEKYEARMFELESLVSSSQPYYRIHRVSNYLKFTTQMTLKQADELQKLAEAFIFSNHSKYHHLNHFYRNKPGAYFDDIFNNHNGVMKPYIKDFNGDQGSPINGKLKGLFFGASVKYGSGKIPPTSCFGEKRLHIPGDLLFSRDMVLYFTDFYCFATKGSPNPIHYVTLVMTKENSKADDFCRTRLRQLNAFNNPFLYKRKQRNRWQVFTCSPMSTLNIEVFYTEDVDIKSLLDKHKPNVSFEYVEVFGRGQSTVKGFPKNRKCPTCNNLNNFTIGSN